MTELCERYEITRQTGYVWLRRYSEAGVAGLMEHSRAAHRHSNQMPEEIEQRVLGLRQTHMRWGPRKLKRILERDEPGQSWPATSTIGALLQREGLVVPRRKRVRTAPYSEPLAHADGANRVWCADFKGWFRTVSHPRENFRSMCPNRTIQRVCWCAAYGDEVIFVGRSTRCF